MSPSSRVSPSTTAWRSRPSGWACSRRHRRKPLPPCSRRSRPATGTSTPRRPTATSVRSVRPSVAPASPVPVIIETKLWVTDYGYDAALHAFDKSTGKLGVDVIDLLLLHQPRVEDFALTVAAYQALEQLLAD